MRYIDDLVLRDRDTNGDGTLDERLYAMQDANWNVTTITNSSGSVHERYAYSPYGAPVFLTSTFASRSSSSFDWRYLFTGRRFDTKTGSYDFRYRSLAPLVGLFLSRDPLGFPNGPNLYASWFVPDQMDPFGTQTTADYSNAPPDTDFTGYNPLWNWAGQFTFTGKPSGTGGMVTNIQFTPHPSFKKCPQVDFIQFARVRNRSTLTPIDPRSSFDLYWTGEEKFYAATNVDGWFVDQAIFNNPARNKWSPFYNDPLVGSEWYSSPGGRGRNGNWEPANLVDTPNPGGNLKNWDGSYMELEWQFFTCAFCRCPVGTKPGRPLACINWGFVTNSDGTSNVLPIKTFTTIAEDQMIQDTLDKYFQVNW